MARKKDKAGRRDGKHADGGSTVEETLVLVKPGETTTHRIVREWHPHAPESLPEIHTIIDSWGRGVTYDYGARLESVPLDYSDVEKKVDRLTRKVKGDQKVVVQETVTEWVERPVERATPAAEPVAEAEEPSETGSGTRAGKERSRPKRRFLSFVGPKAKDGKDAKEGKKGKAKDTSDPDYRPQCSALTEDGAQCRNSARHGSRYCISHFGYQPPTAKGLAQRIEGDAWDPDDDVTDRQSVAAVDTRPAVAKAKDTRLKVRKAAKKGGRKKR